nr:MAG: hypothetical protein [Enquatrovirus sp.]
MASGTYSNTRKKTVSPSNMGNRLVFNNAEKRWNVNVEDLVSQISSLQTTINQQATKIGQLETAKESLENQLTTIRESLNMPCEMVTKEVGSYTITNTDNVILSSGGTITIPAGLSNGRMFTVIQTGTGKVTISPANVNVQVISPLDGSLTLAGANAVVSILIVGSKAHVFGQTE